jgi:hypothetical protein
MEVVAGRCRKLAAQVDELTIGLRQRGAPRTSPEDAAAQLRAVAPLLQALTRYSLAMVDAIYPRE